MFFGEYYFWQKTRYLKQVGVYDELVWQEDLLIARTHVHNMLYAVFNQLFVESNY